jgi:hypothetical protein
MIIELTSSVTGPHAHHRNRRKALNPFFSKSQILALWPYILEKSESLCSILDNTYCDNKKPLNLTKAYGCFTLDVITDYCFGKSFSHILKPGFESEGMVVIEYLAGKIHLSFHLPLIRKIMGAIPKSVLEIVEPRFVLVNDWVHVRYLYRQSGRNLLMRS